METRGKSLKGPEGLKRGEFRGGRRERRGRFRRSDPLRRKL